MRPVHRHVTTRLFSTYTAQVLSSPLRPIVPVSLLSMVLILSACGGESGGSTTIVERVTVESPSTETAAANDARDDAPAKRASVATEDEVVEEAAAAQADTEDCIEVPNVIGLKDHQLGQDTLQAAGFYSLDEKDATGKGRALLWDRNWVDVRQVPAAGKCVAPDTTITLYAKKHGE